MARRFLDDIREDIVTLFADNTGGNISPADLRSVTRDSLDSTVPDEGDIFSTAPTVGVVLTGTYVDLTDIYDGGAGDGSFIDTDFAAGTITGGAIAGFSYTIRAAITLNASNNEVIEFAIGIDGVAEPYFATITGDGMRDQSVSVGAFDRTSGISTVYTLMARAVDGDATITVDAVRLVLVIQPTNNP